ncbi:hypothetical protein ACYCFK_18685 [Stutzerimonas stutzeri]
MSLIDREWFHDRQPPKRVKPKPAGLGAGFLPGLCLGLMIGPVITLCVLFALGYQL